ncbi:glycosyltransferase [Bradyrhizobium centrolobii]|uniref:Glycosyltransferase n=1 Tax=Bradyrhizobium centrolobii TaxID=1505087 RepID=A0A176Z2Y1_9BRAD|nr:glycosyltransferase family 4 protein [Bradyrhizobium centrolobii]OAF13676.1 glycosyltransferase [Bradyrhizobium centrolobii]
MRSAVFAACILPILIAFGSFFADLTSLFAFLEIDAANPPFLAIADAASRCQSLASVGLPALQLKCTAQLERRQALRVLHYMGTNFGMTGVETFILQLTAAQKRHGLIPAVVMELSNRQDVRKIAGERGISVHDLPNRKALASHLPRKLGTAVLRAQRIRLLYELLKENDILHIQAVGLSCFDGFIAAALAGIPVIVTHHGTLSWFAPQRDLLAEVTFWIEKKIASTIVMPYEAALAELISEGVSADQSRVIPFCVDEQLFGDASMPPAASEFTLVLVARMVVGKGHVELLGALSELSPRYPKLRAVFIGDGPTRGQIEEEIDRRGLRQIVECKGKVDHREVPALIRSAQVIVLPTYEPGEMYPLCLLEGMALGLPAIGTRWSGIPDIIEDGVTGIIIEPKDEASLVRAIERFVADPGFLAKARECALARIRSRFTATVVADCYTDLYRDAMSDSTNHPTSHQIRIRPPRKLA